MNDGVFAGQIQKRLTVGLDDGGGTQDPSLGTPSSTRHGFLFSCRSRVPGRRGGCRITASASAVCIHNTTHTTHTTHHNTGSLVSPMSKSSTISKQEILRWSEVLATIRYFSAAFVVRCSTAASTQTGPSLSPDCSRVSNGEQRANPRLGSKGRSSNSRSNPQAPPSRQDRGYP